MLSPAVSSTCKTVILVAITPSTLTFVFFKRTTKFFFCFLLVFFVCVFLIFYFVFTTLHQSAWAATLHTSRTL
uniref:Uncharacterized protein n=1 Tax=Anguilla anguilla TaxID=7936 RepID=A0A0E9X0S0_ANGAN